MRKNLSDRISPENHVVFTEDGVIVVHDLGIWSDDCAAGETVAVDLDVSFRDVAREIHT